MTECNYGDCPNPASFPMTVENGDTGERKDVDLCEIHYHETRQASRRFVRGDDL